MSGGINAPYIWLRTPDGLTSWEFFDRLLTEANVVGTPGSGFGPGGEHYFRLSAFGSHENTAEAVNIKIRALRSTDKQVTARPACNYSLPGCNLVIAASSSYYMQFFNI